MNNVILSIMLGERFFLTFISVILSIAFPLTQQILLIVSVTLLEAASQSTENAEHNEPVTAFKKDLCNQNSMH